MSHDVIIHVHRRAWLIWFLGVSIAIGLAGYLPLRAVSSLTRNSALAGWIVAILLSGSAGWLVFWAFEKSHKALLMVTFGGMLARMVIVGILAAVAALMDIVDEIGFIAGLFGPYFIYQFVEVMILLRYQTAVTSSGVQE
jgi:hypothetical protein